MHVLKMLPAVLLLTFAAPLLAAEPVPCEPPGSAVFATVQRVQGEVIAVPAQGKSRTLHEGDVVHVGERVRAGAAAETVLLARDASMIGLRPGAVFVPESFAAQAKATDRLVMRLVRGGMRVITGWIGHQNRDQYVIKTPAATLGIRGTDHEPWVLSAESAGDSAYLPGAYDKVNRGATVMTTSAGELQIDSGKVGFAVEKPKKRGLLTLLMPVLLERVPDFYVAGRFEQEMDAYSNAADDTSQRRFEETRAAPACIACGPATTVGADWIAAFDKGVENRDAKTVMALFTEDVSVTATVRDTDGKPVKISLTREELADSAVTAMKGLEDYSQQRKTLEVKVLGKVAGEPCARLRVRSIVVEQGKQSGKPYRLESKEVYVLAPRGTAWLAVSASVVQR